MRYQERETHDRKRTFGYVRIRVVTDAVDRRKTGFLEVPYIERLDRDIDLV